MEPADAAADSTGSGSTADATLPDSASEDATVEAETPDAMDASPLGDASDGGGDATLAPDGGDAGIDATIAPDAGDAGDGSSVPDAVADAPAPIEAGPRFDAGTCVYDGGDAGGVAFSSMQALTFSEIFSVQNLAAGDLNGDGRSDIVLFNISMTNKKEILVFVQAAGGGFPSFTTIANSSLSTALAVADVNSDGRADLLSEDPADNSLDVRLGQADGSLAAPVSYQLGTGAQVTSIFTGDFTGDGRTDVLCFYSGAIYLFPQTATGTLGPVVKIDTVGAVPAAVGDVNGDHRLDLVGYQTVGVTTSLSIIPATGPTSFGLPYEVPLDGQNSYGTMAIGDVTGDGLSDVIIAHSANNPDARVIVAKQLDGGVLADADTTYASLDLPSPVALTDVNFDCRNDVVVQHAGWFGVGVYLQKPDGTLAKEVVLPSTYGASVLAVTDLDGDGKPDIVTADQQKLVLFYNTH
jgi:hypothetical protein